VIDDWETSAIFMACSGAKFACPTCIRSVHIIVYGRRLRLGLS
jgi:hypothetical protein